jgi:hypothetical protein
MISGRAVITKAPLNLQIFPERRRGYAKSSTNRTAKRKRRVFTDSFFPENAKQLIVGTALQFGVILRIEAETVGYRWTPRVCKHSRRDSSADVGGPDPGCVSALLNQVRMRKSFRYRWRLRDRSAVGYVTLEEVPRIGASVKRKFNMLGAVSDERAVDCQSKIAG